MNNEGIKWLDEQLKYLEEVRNKMVAYNQATKENDQERRILINTINGKNKELNENKLNRTFINSLERCSIEELKRHVKMVKKLHYMESIQKIHKELASKNKIGHERQEKIKLIYDKHIKIIINEGKSAPEELKNIIEKYKNINLRKYPQLRDGRVKYTQKKLEEWLEELRKHNINLLNYLKDFENYNQNYENQRK